MTSCGLDASRESFQQVHQQTRIHISPKDKSINQNSNNGSALEAIAAASISLASHMKGVHFDLSECINGEVFIEQFMFESNRGPDTLLSLDFQNYPNAQTFLRTMRIPYLSVQNCN